MELSKSKVVIGQRNCTHITIDGTTLEVSDRLRFLGIGITREGKLVPWPESYNDRLHVMWNKLANYGFGASPVPFLIAFKIYI